MVKILAQILALLALSGCAAPFSAPAQEGPRTWLEDGNAFATNMRGTCTLDVTYEQGDSHFVYTYASVEGRPLTGLAVASSPGGESITFADPFEPADIAEVSLGGGQGPIEVTSVHASCD